MSRPRPSSVLRRIPAPLGWLLWAMVIALLAAGCLTGGSFGVAAGSLLVVAVGLPFLRRLRRDGLDPPVVYVLMTVITFGLMSGIWLTSRPLAAPPGLGRDDVAHALLLVSVGGSRVLLGRPLARAGPAAKTGSPDVPVGR